MKFTKMHGTGNDYIYLYEQTQYNLADVAVALSRRQIGVGSDGLIHIAKGEHADFEMRIFNADGTEGEMCGNGIRCVGKYVYDKGYTDKTSLTIQTLAGVRTLTLTLSACGTVDAVSVDMGVPTFLGQQLLEVGGKIYMGEYISIGNPHFAILCEEVGEIDLATIAPQIQQNPLFPQGVNVEFFHRIAPESYAMRVWERGSGETLACGTGACAVFATVRKAGLAPEKITLQQQGGAVSLWQVGDHIAMQGEAVTVFEGEIEMGEEFYLK